MARTKQTCRKTGKTLSVATFPLNQSSQSTMSSDDSISSVSSPVSKKRRAEKNPAKNSCNHLCCDKILGKLRKFSEDQIIIKNELTKINEIMREFGRIEQQPTGNPKRGEKVAESILSEQIKARIEAKRANKKWIDKVKVLEVEGIDDAVMDEVRDSLLRGPSNPKRITVEIAKRIWKEDYMKTRMLGPKTREARVGERTELISESQVQKLKEILSVLTTQLLGETEWRYFVRDPINQASRDSRGWKKHRASATVSKPGEKDADDNDPNEKSTEDK